MNCKINKILSTCLFCFLLCISGPQICRAVSLPVPPEFQERLESLIREYEKISQELDQIQIRLNRDIDIISEEEYKKDTKKLFRLMDDLAEKKKAIRKMRGELDDYFTEPPVLKLVRITGPAPGVQESSNNSTGYPEEIEYRANDSGYTLRVKDESGRLYSSAAVAVTYAPLEIRPGEPFHFEAEARQSAFLDSSQECTGSDPFRMGVQIDPDNSFGSPTVAMARADLKCQAGAVKLTMRFKPKPPVSPEPGDFWQFKYDMESVTSGIPVQGLPFKVEDKEIGSFRLRTKKSSIDMAQRMWYSFDITVSPKVFNSSYGNAPELVLHYRAQDESIAFLPEFQFPEDVVDSLVSVPDLKGLSRSEVIDKLTRSRLDPDIIMGDPAERQALSGMVASQKPEPEERVKLHSKVEVTLYSDFKPVSVVLPDFSGKTVKDIKGWSDEKGVKVKLAASEPAPAESLSYKIKETEPAAGASVSQNSEITVRIYGKYSPEKVIVPHLIGITVKEANARLTETGLKVRFVALGPAPSESLSFKIKDTNPRAGSEIIKGNEIVISVYGKYVQKHIVMPDVSGLTMVEARDKLNEIGLLAQFIDSDHAPSSSLAFRVQDSVPRAGTRILPGAKVEIRVFSKYVPSREEMVAGLDCSRYPGSRAYWDDSKGRPLCGCPGNLEWNLAGTQCVSSNLVNRERCTKSFPGSIPTGRNSNGDLVCDCPGGYTWTTNRSSCVRVQRAQNSGGGGNNRRDECSGYMIDIRMHVGIASALSEVPPLIKSQIENAANNARRRGCSENDVQQALGKFGTGNSGGSSNRSRSGSGGPVELEDNENSLTIFGQDMDD